MVQVHWNKCYFIFIQVQVRFLTILQCSFVNERSNRNGLELQTFVSSKHPQLNNYHCDKNVIISEAWKIQIIIRKPPKWWNEVKLEHWSVVNLRVMSVSTVSFALDQHSTAGSKHANHERAEKTWANHERAEKEWANHGRAAKFWILLSWKLWINISSRKSCKVSAKFSLIQCLWCPMSHAQNSERCKAFSPKIKIYCQCINICKSKIFLKAAYNISRAGQYIYAGFIYMPRKYSE